MWSMPRRLRWRCPATLRNPKGSPPTWRSASRKIRLCNSSIFPRCTLFPHSLIGRRRTRSSGCNAAVPYDFAMPGTAFFAKFGGLYPAYVRGEAYLAAGRGQEAAAEFQKVLDHRGIVLADPIGALAHLQLGRAYVVSGDITKAKRRLSGLPHPLEGCRPGHPRPQTGQRRIREAIVIPHLQREGGES